MAADHLYPRISAPGPSLKRDMVWQDLLEFGGPGATPMELAARLLRDGKATGTVEGCAVRLMPLPADGPLDLPHFASQAPSKEMESSPRLSVSAEAIWAQ